MSSTLWTKVFVYGTLKRGFTNYERYLKKAIDAKRAKFVASGTTSCKYPLVLRPTTRLPATRGPMLMDFHNSSKDRWGAIRGEIFDLDPLALEAMDILEGVKDGYYYKKEIDIAPDGGGDVLSCLCYFYTMRSEKEDADLLNASPLLGSYNDEAHREYKPGPLNYSIVTKIQKDTVPCRRCGVKYLQARNQVGDCKFHGEAFSGETKQRWQAPGDPNHDGNEIQFFYSCCGNSNENSEGCSLGRHISYDEPECCLYKDSY